MTTVDATIRLYCDEPSHTGDVHEAWFHRDTDGWGTVMQPKRHGRDWGPPHTLDVKRQILRGDVFLTKDQRQQLIGDPDEYVNVEVHGPNPAALAAAGLRLRYRITCPACGLDIETKAEKLHPTLDRLADARTPDLTLRGLDYMLKLQA
jgi:hypothetical protein